MCLYVCVWLRAYVLVCVLVCLCRAVSVFYLFKFFLNELCAIVVLFSQVRSTLDVSL